MKILYFHQHFSTPQGATGIRSYEMAKRLIKKGHDVTMVCGSYSGGNTGLSTTFTNGQRSGNVDGIHVIEFSLDYSNSQTFLQRTLAFSKFAYKSIKLSLTLEYDVVFATTTPLTAALPGIFARWLRRKHFIFEVRDLWPELPKEMGVIKNPIILGLLSILEWVAYKSAHGHIGLSPGIVTGIARHLPKDSKIANIPNGCDLGIFSAVGDHWQPINIQDDDFVAIFTGTHGQANGLENILAAAKVLQEKNINNIKIILIGQGKLKPVLQAQATSQQLNNVIFLDPVNKEKLAQLMTRANVGLQLLANIPAFYYGTSPNKFFDYIAAGLPVINNYPGWLAELITQYQCGVAVPADDNNALAQALIDLNLARDKLPDMSGNALRLAREKFDRQILSDKFVQYIEESYHQHD
ncbi:glycosyltransferase family 4 protein [Colwellia sp. Bg11-12]|uniref:glycosyltransferase family 4 protein n=1 Tax=Colwellia sp. Bg11-12 TaxID=2759817 RepID=UPI0015F5E97B|nr:glycosyltransferase family 4 protein [Colwellia sp. Bg11-12]MBA6263214.1 glycosyltransferase family 4 protein [Colwellia sp. Bg11-12]